MFESAKNTVACKEVFVDIVWHRKRPKMDNYMTYDIINISQQLIEILTLLSRWLFH